MLSFILMTAPVKTIDLNLDGCALSIIRINEAPKEHPIKFDFSIF